MSARSSMISSRICCASKFFPCLCRKSKPQARLHLRATHEFCFAEACDETECRLAKQQLQKRCRRFQLWICGEVIQFLWIGVMVIEFNATLAIVPFRIPPLLCAKSAANHLIVRTPSNDLSARGYCRFRLRVLDQGFEAGTFSGRGW